MMETSDLIAGMPDALVLALGDNAYQDGTAQEFEDHYRPSWGRFNDRVWTCPGNHDYHSMDETPFPFYDFFGERAGPDKLGYYSLNVGAWHLVCLNSEISRDQESDQITWLKADLLRNKEKPILAFFHRPLFSSGTHGNDSSQIEFWHTLFQRNAEIVLNGHDHHYERFDPQDPESNFVARGIREFVVGTGGKSLRWVTGIEKHSVVRNDDTHGVLLLTLRPTSYEWRFLAVRPPFTDESSGPVDINVHFEEGAMFQVTLTEEQRRALKNAAALLRGQAEGLRRTGSSNTVAALESYVATLETLGAAQGSVPVSAEQSTHVEKTEHILEGVRDGLSNADFEKRAQEVEQTIRNLDQIVTNVNTQASQR
jgi:hypothetical protein